MEANITALFGFYTIIPLIEFVFEIGVSIFVIYFSLSVMKFMKMKIELDGQRNLQMNLLLKLYKKTNETNETNESNENL